MLYKHQYVDDEERQLLITNNANKYLVEEQNLLEGNFLIFSDDPENDTKQIVYVNVPEEEFESLKHDNQLVKAQNNALSERADFVEDVIAEMAIQVYQ